MHDSSASSNARAVAVGARCGATSSGKDDEGEGTAEVCVQYTADACMNRYRANNKEGKRKRGEDWLKVDRGRREFIAIDS